MTGTSRASCPRCRERVIHCHGTLIVHASDSTGGLECTEPACVELDLACHDLVVDCAGCTLCSDSAVDLAVV